MVIDGVINVLIMCIDVCLYRRDGEEEKGGDILKTGGV